MDFTIRVFDILYKIKRQPALFFGKSLERLIEFLSGYIQAYRDFTGKQFIFEALFQEFIETRYKPIDGKYHSQNWLMILNHYHPGEKAFDAFFEELELFKKEVGIGPDSLLHGKETCDVAKIKSWLAENGGQIVKLEFRNSKYGFVYCKEWTAPVSADGIRYGYLKEGLVYCDVYSSGLPFDTWVGSFHTYDDKNPYYYIDEKCRGQIYRQVL